MEQVGLLNTEVLPVVVVTMETGIALTQALKVPAALLVVVAVALSTQAIIHTLLVLVVVLVLF
jgi:hypothetical protein